MAALKYKDIAKMDGKERQEKLKELKIEAIKAGIKGKQNAKLNMREIKKAIARILTAENAGKTGGKR